MKILNNSENYNKVIGVPITLIFKKYVELIHEYLLFSNDNVYIQKPMYLKYVLIRGLETIQNVFNILLLYTKNLDLVTYHCQKSYYYYVEFIGQIGDDNHSFLQLNSKDATLFVYKKTIFEINNDYKIQFEPPTGQQQNIIVQIKLLSTIFNCITSYCIENKHDSSPEPIDVKEIYTRLIKLSQKLIIFEKQLDFETKLSVIYDFIKFIINKSLNCDKFLSIIDLFVKKIYNKPITLTQLKLRVFDPEFDTLLNNATNIKIVNWVFN
jgi:hypothetical protein